MKKLILMGAMLLTIFMIIACSEKNNPLDNTSWTLLSINDKQAVGDTDIEFYQEDSIGGSTGCNGYNGRYKVYGTSFIVEEMVATERYCPEIFEQESVYLDILNNAEKFDIIGSHLVITSSEYGTAMFSRK